MSTSRSGALIGARHLSALLVCTVLTAASCTSSAASDPAMANSDVTTASAVDAGSSGGADNPAQDEIALPGDPPGLTSEGTTATTERDTAVPAETAVPIDTVSNEGVLAAAVIILSDGDLEGAIAEGLVTEAEAEAALLALETDTLSRYADTN